MQRKCKRGLSVLTASVMTASQLITAGGLTAIGVAPIQALAAGEDVVQLGAGTIGNGDHIQYGTKSAAYAEGDTTYRVLDAGKDNTRTKGAMFVMSEELWGTGGAEGGRVF